MQTANFVSQWNKFSSLDCVISNSQPIQSNPIQCDWLGVCMCVWRENSSFFSNPLNSFKRNRFGYKFHNIVREKRITTKRWLSNWIRLNAKWNERKLIAEWPESKINRFLMVSFCEQQRQFGENSSSAVLIITWYRIHFFALVLAIIITLKSIYFRTGSAFC